MQKIRLIVLSSDTKFQQKVLSFFKDIIEEFYISSSETFNIEELKRFVSKNSSRVLGLVFRFGKILPSDIVQKYVFINIHYSLLPKYRGANPVIAQILNNEKETGITVHRVRPQLDSGEILFQIRKKLPYLMNQVQMKEWLDSITYKEVLAKLYEDIRQGRVFDESEFVPQQGLPSYAPLSLSLKKNAFCNVYHLTANEVMLRVKAFYNNPSAWLWVKIDKHIKRRLNLYDVDVITHLHLKPAEVRFLKAPIKGMVIGTLVDAVLVKDGSLESKRRLKQAEWLTLKGRIEIE